MTEKTYLQYILERNNISKRKLLIESALESLERTKDESLSESVRLGNAYDYAVCRTNLNLLYPDRIRKINKIFGDE